MKKIEADQSLPYKLMKNPFMHGKQYKEYLYIVNKNINNITPSEVIELFKKLSNTGCSCAMLANLLIDSLYFDDLEFKNTFGFSILTRGSIDCNKLMIDIFSKLYKIMRIKFVEYDTYKCRNEKEAVLNILGKECQTNSEAIIELFNCGISGDGKDTDGNLIFKNKRNPKITNYIGSVSEVAKKKFNIDGINSVVELKKLCNDLDIQVEFKDIEIHEKLSGLGTKNFNYWSNYYLNKYNVNLELFNSSIVVSDFNNNYNEFMNYLSKLVIDGYSISVSTGPNSEAYMYTKRNSFWHKISSEEAGHVMLFKGFSESKDIIVASYGIDYIIPKEYFNILEFNKIAKLEKNITKEKSV